MCLPWYFIGRDTTYTIANSSGIKPDATISRMYTIRRGSKF